MGDGLFLATAPIALGAFQDKGQHKEPRRSRSHAPALDRLRMTRQSKRYSVNVVLIFTERGPPRQSLCVGAAFAPFFAVSA